MYSVYYIAYLTKFTCIFSYHSLGFVSEYYKLGPIVGYKTLYRRLIVVL